MGQSRRAGQTRAANGSCGCREVCRKAGEQGSCRQGGQVAHRQSRSLEEDHKENHRQEDFRQRRLPPRKPQPENGRRRSHCQDRPRSLGPQRSRSADSQLLAGHLNPPSGREAASCPGIRTVQNLLMRFQLAKHPPRPSPMTAMSKTASVVERSDYAASLNASTSSNQGCRRFHLGQIWATIFSLRDAALAR